MDEEKSPCVGPDEPAEVATGFSLDKFKTKPRAAGDPAVAKPRRHRHDNFVQISRKQLAILRQGKAHASVWNVFAELVWLDWDGGGKPFKFSRKAVGKLNISHDSGARAIHMLAELGLISFNQPTAQSSFVVTVRKL
jgi:hypothetical protein